MEDSILLSVKQYLGLEAEYTVFDPDVLMAINSALMVLEQLGISSDAVPSVADDGATWSMLGSKFPGVNLGMLRSYVYGKARLLFDPPTSSFGLTALEKQVQEMEWRLNVQVETPSLNKNLSPTT